MSKEELQELKVTSPEEYAVKAQQANTDESAGFLHKLKKTGAVVRLRRVDMEALALVGSLPMSLVTAALGDDKRTKALASGKTTPTPEEIERGNSKLIFIRQMVVENCLEPRIRYFEGIGVYFVNAKGEQVAKVDKDDFMEMFDVISGEEGADGLNSFRNRKTRRASAAKSRSKALRSGPVGIEDEKQPVSIVILSRHAPTDANRH
jgi:hypothetical protein